MITTDKKSFEERVSSLRDTFNQCLKINAALSQTMTKLDKQLAELEKQTSEDTAKIERENHDKFMEKKLEKELPHIRVKTFSAEIPKNSTRPSNSFDLSRKDPPKSRPIYSQRTPTTLNKIETGTNFIAEYNSILNETDGFKIRTARENFAEKYKVRAFSCTNFNERTNQPFLQPIFIEADSIQSGDYWAIPAGNIFKVIPNIKSYNENCHVARAMGEVFDSNFVSETYNKIQVEAAAEFTVSGQNWILNLKGKLVLR